MTLLPKQLNKLQITCSCSSLPTCVAFCIFVLWIVCLSVTTSLCLYPEAGCPFSSALEVKGPSLPVSPRTGEYT